jgi:cytochrome oxidase assembly protein ShyY1
MGVSVIAGIWQYGRHVERAHTLQSFEAATVLPVVPLGEVSVPGASAISSEAMWRRVEVTGHFAPDPPTPLRNRPVEHVAAYQYLAWFEPADGGALLVNAGWLEVSSLGDDPLPPVLPGGQLTIEVVLRDLELDDGRRDAGATRINLAHVPAPPAEPFPAYGMLRDSCATDGPCVEDLGLAEVPLPHLSTGPHLSYAWQWWAFAALAPVGAGVLLRRDDVSDEGHRKKVKKRERQRGLSDEDVEDAL